MTKAQKLFVQERFKTFEPDMSTEDFSQVPDRWCYMMIGLGDAIAESGALAYSARQNPDKNFTFPCLETNLASVCSFYVDHPNIEVVEVNKLRKRWIQDEEGDEVNLGVRLVLGLGDVRPKDSKIDMFEYLYNQIGVPYTERWDSCPIEAASQKCWQYPVPDCEYAFVHHKFAHEIVEDKVGPKRYIFPEASLFTSNLAYAEIIRNAAEVHVINSSFLWMVEHLDGVKGKVFWHRYARQYLKVWQEYKMRKEWIIYE